MCAAGAPSSALVPAVVVVAAGDRADADEVDRELTHLRHHPAAEELADRAFGPGNLALQRRGERAHRRELLDAALDVEVGEALADRAGRCSRRGRRARSMRS